MAADRLVIEVGNKIGVYHAAGILLCRNTNHKLRTRVALEDCPFLACQGYGAAFAVDSEQCYRLVECKDIVCDGEFAGLVAVLVRIGVVAVLGFALKGKLVLDGVVGLFRIGS